MESVRGTASPPERGGADFPLLSISSSSALISDVSAGTSQFQNEAESGPAQAYDSHSEMIAQTNGFSLSGVMLASDPWPGILCTNTGKVGQVGCLAGASFCATLFLMHHCLIDDRGEQTMRLRDI